MDTPTVKVSYAAADYRERYGISPATLVLSPSLILDCSINGWGDAVGKLDNGCVFQNMLVIVDGGLYYGGYVCGWEGRVFVFRCSRCHENEVHPNISICSNCEYEADAGGAEW